MYIDDDRDDQEIFEQALEELQIYSSIMIFSNGLEALKHLESEKNNPSIIFCDINMPLMNGFELRKRISENKKLERACIPFIFYSTSAEKKYVDKAFELTVQGYFKKPVHLAEIKIQLKKIFDYWAVCRHPKNCL